MQLLCQWHTTKSIGQPPYFPHWNCTCFGRNMCFSPSNFQKRLRSHLIHSCLKYVMLLKQCHKPPTTGNGSYHLKKWWWLGDGLLLFYPYYILFFTSPSTWEIANGMIFLGIWQAAFCPKWPPPASSNPKMCVARRGVALLRSQKTRGTRRCCPFFCSK